MISLRYQTYVIREIELMHVVKIVYIFEYLRILEIIYYCICIDVYIVKYRFKKNFYFINGIPELEVNFGDTDIE